MDHKKKKKTNGGLSDYVIKIITQGSWKYPSIMAQKTSQKMTEIHHVAVHYFRMHGEFLCSEGIAPMNSDGHSTIAIGAF